MGDQRTALTEIGLRGVGIKSLQYDAGKDHADIVFVVRRPGGHYHYDLPVSIPSFWDMLQPSFRAAAMMHCSLRNAEHRTRELSQDAAERQSAVSPAFESDK